MFIAASVVPSTANATVKAMRIIRANPFPPSIVSPIRRTRSPIGALEAAAAAIPVTRVPSAAVPTSFSEMAKLAAKYWSR